MPIYEYKCSKCGETFEKRCSFQAKQETACPTCGSCDVKKLISLFGTTKSDAASSSLAAPACAPTRG